MDEKYNMTMVDDPRCFNIHNLNSGTAPRIPMDMKMDKGLPGEVHNMPRPYGDTNYGIPTSSGGIAGFDMKMDKGGVYNMPREYGDTNTNFGISTSSGPIAGFDIKKEVEDAIQKLAATDEGRKASLSYAMSGQVDDNDDSSDDDDDDDDDANQMNKKRSVGNPLFNLLPEKCKPEFYECEVCKLSFPKEKKLVKHMKKMHNYVSNYNNPTLPSMNFDNDFNSSESQGIEHVEEGGSGFKRKADDDAQPSMDGEAFDPTLTKNIKLETADDAQANANTDENGSSDMSPLVTIPKLFICKFCFATFTGKDAFIEHTQTHEKEVAKPTPPPKPFECDLCGATFAKLGNKNTHRLTHFGLKPYECDICGSKFTTSGGKTVHMMLHTGERPYKCDICHAAFNQKGNLTKHLSIHTGEKPHKCNFCEASFVNSTLLKKHSMLHTGDKAFRCEICCMKFLKESSFIAHQKLHTGSQKPFQCEICGATFVLRFSYTQHMKRNIHHGDDNMQFKCPYCDLELTSEQRYKNHLRKHTDPEKAYKCDECNAAFQQKATLERHRKVHSGDRPFHCGLCDAKFAQRVNLIVHERLHTGETPFKCEVCDLTYFSKSNYVVHMKLHSQSQFQDSNVDRFNPESSEQPKEFNSGPPKEFVPETSKDMSIAAIKNIYNDSAKHPESPKDMSIAAIKNIYKDSAKYPEASKDMSIAAIKNTYKDSAKYPEASKDMSIAAIRNIYKDSESFPEYSKDMSKDMSIAAIKNIYRDSENQRETQMLNRMPIYENDIESMKKASTKGDSSRDMLNGMNLGQNQDQESKQIKQEVEDNENTNVSMQGSERNGVKPKDKWISNMGVDTYEHATVLTGFEGKHVKGMKEKMDDYNKRQDVDLEKLREMEWEKNALYGFDRKFSVDDVNQNHNLKEKQIDEDGNFYDNN